ncbi:MAG: type II toxin-antitoxin system HicB family antitoxin [Candidatus Sumerlaeaceae bacterium]
MDYLAVIEGEPGNYSACVPDLPGCITVGETASEIRDNIREAIAAYLEETTRRGQRVPAPSTTAITVSAAA